jgi:plasmid stabilization system protein ParE
MDNVATLGQVPIHPLGDGLNIMSARGARNCFGACLDAARREPVVVTRNDRPAGILIFIEEAVDSLLPECLIDQDPGYEGRLFGNVSAPLARIESGDAADRGHHRATAQLRERLRKRKARQDGVRRGIFSPDAALGDLYAILADDDRVAGPTTRDAVGGPIVSGIESLRTVPERIRTGDRIPGARALVVRRRPYVVFVKGVTEGVVVLNTRPHDPPVSRIMATSRTIRRASLRVDRSRRPHQGT